MMPSWGERMYSSSKLQRKISNGSIKCYNDFFHSLTQTLQIANVSIIKAQRPKYYQVGRVGTQHKYVCCFPLKLGLETTFFPTKCRGTWRSEHGYFKSWQHQIKPKKAKLKKQACEHFNFCANAAIQCSAANSKWIKIWANISKNCKPALHSRWIQK